MLSRDGRPIYLNLVKIKLPISGVISIMHRVFGLVMSLSIPLFTYLFGLSLQSKEGYNEAISLLSSDLLSPIFAMLIWAFVHHFVAGIRYLLIDVEIGVSKVAAIQSSWIVLFISLLISFLICLRVWL